ncbi:CRISPR-associated RAMP protein Csx10 [Chloroflexia bacterium SDU3-3]|nr:CRISPR-associated RAMP protein Csx10 [Chloroflexia bacterium SDU3-3]
MRYLPITIEARGPLAFPERKPGVQFRASLPYVPGAVLYGALGARLGGRQAHTPEELARLFRAVRCHNAYPALAGDPWSRPLPMTALRPKGDEQITHDALYDRVCWEQQRPPALIYAPTDAEGRPWEAVGRAFYTRDQKTHTPVFRSVQQRVLTRVAINRRRGTTADGQLFSPLVISEVMELDGELVPTRFLGSVAVPEDVPDLVGQLAAISLLGGRQTTGSGEVSIQVGAELPAEDHVADLRRRIDAMSARFRDTATLYEAMGGTPWTPGTIFTVNLLSDALLTEQGWLPTNQLSPAMLKERTGIDARLVRAWATTSAVGGWNVSWQRPKPTAVATQMGSLFVYEVPGRLDDAQCQRLVALEHDGIGDRRAEGYGQVRICDEFHL